MSRFIVFNNVEPTVVNVEDIAGIEASEVRNKIYEWTFKMKSTEDIVIYVDAKYHYDLDNILEAIACVEPFNPYTVERTERYSNEP